ncbi:Sas10/Utp3/C1D family-domain-containing protein [Podospora australis]|uniref:Exosome complex protein n=1 Tax=Podospora australis TaxID=1536484 RepID=A0AAN7ANG8_9PEZI|nr:Sas10/Utp3/C1D family-domain-containing protein [Podospora australis]
MDVSDVTPQLEQLDEDLTALQDALKPLLGDLGDLSSKLPLLDKAKLYVLTSYAIESLLFSALRLNEVDTKNHPVFTELTRVKQYFEKIQKLETPPAERETTVNTEAVARFVRNDLGDNKDIKDKLSELIAREKAKAAAKASEKKRPAEESAADEKSAQPQEKQTTYQQNTKNPAKPSNMPRQSRSSARPAPSRPTVPTRSAPAPTQQQQTRPATTYAPANSAAPHAPTATPTAGAPSQGPGLMAQMASTAAGVAVGSSIGHVIGGGISSIFGGGSSAAPEPTQATQAESAQNNNSWGNNCQMATQQFTKCMDDNSGNMQICGWYLEQLKACQAAASQY